MTNEVIQKLEEKVIEFNSRINNEPRILHKNHFFWIKNLNIFILKNYQHMIFLQFFSL